jgi:hypothetical protein
MKKLSKETAELMSKLKDAVEEEGAICAISIGKGKYLSQALHGSANDIVALLCCGVDQVAQKTGEQPLSILIKMINVMINAGEE